MSSFFITLRLVAATMLVCCVAYPLAVLGLAQSLWPDNARGRLVHAADGTVIGSRQIAQAFTAPRYFWPRPSAVDYNGAGAGGSNKAPTNAVLAERAQEAIARHGGTVGRRLPADLATASGSGLDPHISAAAAHFQVARIAAARNTPGAEVRGLIDRFAFAPGGPLAPDPIVNVLELNLALDRLMSPP